MECPRDESPVPQAEGLLFHSRGQSESSSAAPGKPNTNTSGHSEGVRRVMHRALNSRACCAPSVLRGSWVAPEFEPYRLEEEESPRVRWSALEDSHCPRLVNLGLSGSSVMGDSARTGEALVYKRMDLSP